MGTTNKHPDGVETYPADAQDLESYRRAEADLARLRIPTLLHADNSHERLFIAGLDGTGNSMFDDDPKNWSVVAKIHQQVRALEDQGITNIAGGYVEGTFTQNGTLNTPQRLLDGRLGITFEDRVETAYYQLCVQAKKWIDEDPNAQIRVAGVGFSRGAEGVAALERMIEERGIRDPTDAKIRMDKENLITRIEYADKPLLVPPGKTLQAALLFDPVAEGVERFDRRLPSSTMATFQISAEDERRNLFKANDHVPPGFSEDRRDLNSIVGGAHSDIGNTYEKNGLGVLSFNLGVEFMNRLSDRPYLEKQAVPEDASQFVVHRSEQGLRGFYRTSSFDKDGLRDRLQDQSPQRGMQHKDAISPELEQQVERREGPTPGPDKSASLDAMENDPWLQTSYAAARGARAYRAFATSDHNVDAALDAALKGDDKALVEAANRFADSPAGLAVFQQAHDQFVREEAERQRQQEEQRQRELAEQQAQEPRQRGPVLSFFNPPHPHHGVAPM